MNQAFKEIFPADVPNGKGKVPPPLLPQDGTATKKCLIC